MGWSFLPIPIVEPSEREIERRIRRRVRRVARVKDCKVIVSGGKRPEVRLRVLLEGDPDNATVHSISSRLYEVVSSLIPNSRVLIRTEPESSRENEEAWEMVKRIADHEPGSRGAHNIHLRRTDGSLGVDFHLEVSSRMTVEQAHEVARRVEKKLKAADPKISEVVIHEETASATVSRERAGHGTELSWYIDDIVRRFPEARLVSPPVIRRLEKGGLHVILHVAFSPRQSIQTASEVSSRLEASIKGGYQSISRVDVVQEPTSSDATGGQSRP